MTASENFATLRIVSQSITPPEITQALGAEPSRVQVKGEARTVGSRRPYEAHSWLLDSTVPVETHIEEHIRELLEFIASRAEGLNRLVDTSDTHIEIFCDFGDDDGRYGLSLDPELIKKLALVPMSLSLTWLMPDPDEQIDGDD